MTQGDYVLLFQQRQEYLANQQFDAAPSFIADEIVCQDAYISEDERWEELCSTLPPQS